MNYIKTQNRALILLVLALCIFLFAAEDSYAGSAEGVSATVTLRSIKVTVSAPNGGENWMRGSTQQIAWNYTGPASKNVILEFSSNNGSNWSNITTVLATSSPYNWTVPNVTTAQAKVRIRSVDYQAVADTSNAVFSIISTDMTLISPNGGEKWQAGKTKAITWTSSNASSTMKLEYSTNSGTNWTQITASTANSGSYNWVVPNTASATVKVRVTSNQYTDSTDESNAVFSIVNLVVSSPNGGDMLITGGSHNITWTPTNLSGTNADILYSTNAGNGWISIATNQPNNGSYSWTNIPNTITSQGRIRIHVTGDSTISDNSDNNFSITTGSTITLTSPSGGEKWQAGKTKAITWTSSDAGSTVRLEYSSNSGTNWTQITASTANSGSYNWVVPSTASATNKVRITSNENTTLVSMSDPFTIFMYPAAINISVNLSAAPANSVTGYRMFSLPGNTNLTASQVFSGDPLYDWSLEWDNGAAENHMVRYDGSDIFRFTPGKAFWLLSLKPVSVSASVSNVTIDSTNIFLLPLHNGWNQIANPFRNQLSWSEVRALNNLTNNHLLWIWEGSWSNESMMQPYEGYYYNNVSNLPSLKIPYNPDSTLALAKPVLGKTNVEEKEITLVLSGEGGQSSGVTFSFSKTSGSGYDEHDYFAPPSDFESVSLLVRNDSLHTVYKYLRKDSRSALEENHEYQLRIRNRTDQEALLTPEGTEQLGERRMMLADPEYGRQFDLSRNTQPLKIPAGADRIWRVYIGSDEFIEGKKNELLVGEFRLHGSYPNPFNSMTSVSFALPKPGRVSLTVYDILGRQVRYLSKDYSEAGYQELPIDATALASGVYIYTIRFGVTSLSGKCILNK